MQEVPAGQDEFKTAFSSLTNGSSGPFRSQTHPSISSEYAQFTELVFACALSYQWQFNGTNLANATAAILALANVQPTVAGNYVVVVTNSLSAATSSVAALVVAVVPDPQLSAALGAALSRAHSPDQGNPDLAGLGSLWACNYEITNLSGLELAVNLTNLNLAGNAIGDLGVLTNLNHLSSLEVQNNSVADLSALAALTNLQHLALGGNPINRPQNEGVYRRED